MTARRGGWPGGPTPQGEPPKPPIFAKSPPGVVDAPLPRQSNAGRFADKAYAALDGLCAELDALHAENGALRHDLDAARSERDTVKAELSRHNRAGW